MRHTPTLLLFDVDLTLVNAGGIGQVAMRTAGREVCGPCFTFDGVSFGGRLDPLIFADAVAGCNGYDFEQKHAEFRAAYIRELSRLLSEPTHPVRAMPGVESLLATLLDRSDRQGDVVLALLTGNYAETARLKLEAAGLDRDWFAFGCFGDEAPSRDALAALALVRYQELTGEPADPSRVIVIGDTEHDVRCAKVNGLVSYAVASGRVGPEVLDQAGADIVVEDLTDPAPLFSLLDRHAAS